MGNRYGTPFLQYFLLLLFLSSISSLFAQQPIHLEKDLEIHPLTEDIYVVVHSFPWGANSLLVRMGPEDFVLVDTPYTPEATESVLTWIERTFGAVRVIAINTGYHVDNLGGNKALLDRGIPVFGSDKTVELLQERGEQTRDLTLGWIENPGQRTYKQAHAEIPYREPDHVFPLEEGLHLNIGAEDLQVYFPGESHAPDNVVVYFPQKKLLFGGCMLRAGNGLGNTADANLEQWKSSLLRLKSFQCEYIIPGHGIRFDKRLIDHSIALLP